MGKSIEEVDVTELPYSQLPDMPIIRFPEPVLSELKMGQADVAIRSSKPMPNRWHRFWYKVLLDWEWREIDASQDND